MIKRIGKNKRIEEGDFIEITGYREPLYLFHDGKLNEITPQEFNYLILKCFDKRKRGFELTMFRIKNR